ncbi:DNA repair protein rad50 [Marasmius crinis-equi]|uniref:DNA repair protein rad50 n=1 Tax=Marasmius crinis-equi TaxID=585013 RepID=A0ABR3EW11_9AGAR
MASLNKLAIRGIRSFDDKQISVIEFFNPVTVIVGHNGSGKTTIIECLKYATTGDQPPNTRGGAFVHDPKMANEKEVKAQVKLRFHAANGTRMLAVRNLSVTAKKTSGLTMKTLESILALADGNTEKGGKRGVISTKCAEMDAEIPQLLGVSKSVLENVIFCHQEDSWWPLAEPAALKKKFDDIFEATRYTKALDNIKSLRKDRVAELKAEKERLEGLAREKAHADKLRKRINDLSADIAQKEVEYEDSKKDYDNIVEHNRKFQEYATFFREIYLKVENLEVRKGSLQGDLDDAKMNLKELPGKKEDLEAQLESFDDRMNRQKMQRKTYADKLQDVQEDLKAANKRQMELVEEKAAHAHDATAQQERIKTRATKIKEIVETHSMQGYHQDSQDRDQVSRFISELDALLRDQKASDERRSKQEEYNAKSRKLTEAFANQQSACTTLRKQIGEKTNSIESAERQLDDYVSAPSQLSTLQDDIEEKNKRAEKVRADFKSAKHDERLSALNEKKRMAEHRRDDLTTELKALNTQVELHARLSYKKKDLKAKSSEINQALEATNAKLRKLGAKDVKAENIDREVSNLVQRKEDEMARSEARASQATKDLQALESTLVSLNKQVENYRDEAKGKFSQHETYFSFSRSDDCAGIKSKIADDLKQGNYASVEDGLRVVTEELDLARNQLGKSSSKMLEDLLERGEKNKTCPTCNRAMNTNELRAFKIHLQKEIEEYSPEKLKDMNENLTEWTKEFNFMQELRPAQTHLNKLTINDIPKVEEEISDAQSEIKDASEKAGQATEEVRALKKQQRDLQSVNDNAKAIERLQKEVERLQADIEGIERELSVAGTTRTPDDVQTDIDTVSAEIHEYEKESRTISADKERMNNLQRSLDHDIHRLQLDERDLQGKVKEKATLEQQIERWKTDIRGLNQNLKSAEVHVAEAQGPIDVLDSEHQDQDGELQRQLSKEEQRLQDIRFTVDQFKAMNKDIERYVRDRKEERMRECHEKLGEQELRVKELTEHEKQCRKDIEMVDKELSESTLFQKNLRDNIRTLKLAQQIEATQAEINEFDMEKAAKAKRDFKEKWPGFKQREDDLHQQYSHLAGEISSKKSQLSTWETDLKKDFKDINKRYTDQLIRVKMSDMANNDLEKYAKALDNAIMKYHGLKMEEVNDTMRHLWNKTYQGTDIDGIKIRSDVEGGASKRSYNYRVVMTKDQVEMDMRGRCSAGQKMLASIIIRLALSDSFGQNCGILALDEPTNALDTENIDALASSLVDIINERKNHSNFQLIIITHDENFLRKLGQSDVMEYYW